MHSGRDFLKAAAVSLALILTERAGSQISPNAQDVAFADFESGTYDGWTLTGAGKVELP